MSNKTGTEFTSETTNHADAKNGLPGLPLMLDAGRRLASISAPSNAYEVRTSSTSAVKEK